MHYYTATILLPTVVKNWNGHFPNSYYTTDELAKVNGDCSSNITNDKSVFLKRIVMDFNKIKCIFLSYLCFRFIHITLANRFLKNIKKWTTLATSHLWMERVKMLIEFWITRYKPNLILAVLITLDIIFF